LLKQHQESDAIEEDLPNSLSLSAAASLKIKIMHKGPARREEEDLIVS
jgi:hypothetical protein